MSFIYEKRKGGCEFSVKSENRVCPRTTSRCASHAFLFIRTPDRRHQIYRNFVSKQCSQGKKQATSEPMFLSKFFVSNSVDFQIVSKLHLCKWLQYNFWQPQNQLRGLVWPCGKLATIPILCFYLWSVVLSRQYWTTSWLHVKYSLKASSIPLIPFIIPSTSCSLFLSRAHCIEDNEDCTRLWDFFPAGQQLHQRGYHAAVHHHWQIDASELVRAKCRTIDLSGCATADDFHSTEVWLEKYGQSIMYV